MFHAIRFFVAVICFAIAGLQAAPAQAERRVALVIGNSAYVHAPTLRNPANDARAIADLLRQIGFDDVGLKLDLGFDGLRLALRDFGQRTHGAEVAVVYFAGHGLELGGENFLVPVDAALKSASSVAFEAATLSSVLDAIRPVARLRLVILDACRNNPLAARMQVAGGLTRSVPRGLGRIEPTGDVLVAYAAKAGTVAEDGKGRHSPYAEALLSTLATPGLDIRLAMGRVRDLVLAKTGGAQEPFVYGSLGGANVALVSLGLGEPVNAGAVGADAQAGRDYELAAKVGTKEAWDAFLTAHSTGFHADLARASLSKLAARPPAPSPHKEQPQSEAKKSAPAPTSPKEPGVDIARLVACCVAYCRREQCNSPPLPAACETNSLRSQATSKASYKQMMINFGCGTPAELAASHKSYCANAVPMARKMIARGEADANSPFANYIRGKCGGL